MESVSSKTLIAASVSAIALGIAVYIMSKDDAEPLDPSGKHTLKKLKQILDEVKLEYTCIYTRNYNIMLKAKAAGDFDDSLLGQLEGLVNQEINAKTIEVCAYNQKHGLQMEDLTKQRLEEWIKHYSNDPEVKKQGESISKLHDDVFVKQQIDHIDYAADIPEKFTKEMYISTFRKIWATIRHDIWKEIKAKGNSQLTEKVFTEIYNDVHGRFEKIRTDIYCMMMD